MQQKQTRQTTTGTSEKNTDNCTVEDQCLNELSEV